MGTFPTQHLLNTLHCYVPENCSLSLFSREKIKYIDEVYQRRHFHNNTKTLFAIYWRRSGCCEEGKRRGKRCRHLCKTLNDPYNDPEKPCTRKRLIRVVLLEPLTRFPPLSRLHVVQVGILWVLRYIVLVQNTEWIPRYAKILLVFLLIFFHLSWKALAAITTTTQLHRVMHW